MVAGPAHSISHAAAAVVRVDAGAAGFGDDAADVVQAREIGSCSE
jgi:hypothetical protein